MSDKERIAERLRGKSTKDCPDCGHPWAAHDLADYRDSEGRTLTDTAPLIEVCTAGSGKELGSDDHPLQAACGCIRTYWPDPPYGPASTGVREDEARVEVSVPAYSIREAMAESRDLLPQHRYHILCAKLLARISAYGPCHDHTASEPCTPECPVYDPAYDPAPPTLKGEDDE